EQSGDVDAMVDERFVDLGELDGLQTDALTEAARHLAVTHPRAQFVAGDPVQPLPAVAALGVEPAEADERLRERLRREVRSDLGAQHLRPQVTEEVAVLLLVEARE